MNSDLIFIDENGVEIRYRVLFTFDSNETNKTYIVYTNDEKDSSGNIKAFTLCHYIDDEGKKLMEVNSEKEINTIMTLFESYLNSSKK